MINTPRCMLYSGSASWSSEIMRMMDGLARPEVITDLTAAAHYLQTFNQCTIVVDIRHDDAFQVINYAKQYANGNEIIVFGAPRSDPALRAKSMGIFDLLPFDVNRTEFRKVLGYANRLTQLHHTGAAPGPPPTPNLPPQNEQHAHPPSPMSTMPQRYPTTSSKKASTFSCCVVSVKTCSGSIRSRMDPRAARASPAMRRSNPRCFGSMSFRLE